MQADSKYFHEGHINDTGISLCTEALLLDRRGDLPLPLQRHLESCAICRGEAMELYSAAAGMGYPLQGTHPALDRKRAGRMVSIRRLWPVAAAAAVFIFVSTWVLRQHTQPVKTPQVVENPAPSGVTPEEAAPPAAPEDGGPSRPRYPKPAQADRYAVAFIPAESLENLTGLAMRSGSFEVSAPLPGAEFPPGIPIAFRWSGAPAGDLVFTLLNNRAERVYQLQTIASSATVSEPLAPGLYYWQLETAEDLLYTGKFAVLPR